MLDNSTAKMEHTPLLSSEQQQLLCLNGDFLKLLRQSSDPTAQASANLRRQLNLPTVQAATLEQCDAAGLQRMAACGFSLFSLSLHRTDIWQPLLRMRPGENLNTTAENDANAALLNACIGLLECALFLAWHLAQQGSHQGRLLLGMSDDCARLVAQLNLLQCRHIAHTQLQLLSPRWRHHPYFWADLLRYGQHGDPQHFKLARLLGSQLLAQELEPSAILRLSGKD